MRAWEPEKISGSQLMWLLVTTVLPTAVLFIPAATIKEAGTLAWADGLVVSTVWGLVIVKLTCSLGERFPGKPLVEYSGHILGKYPGKLVGLFYIFVFIYSNSIILREFAEFLVTAFMQETPLIVFVSVMLVLAASGVRNGIEVIARMNHFVVSLMFFALIFIFALVLGEAQVRHLFPVFENGVKPFIRGALTPMGWRGEVFLTLVLLPYLNNYREARSAGYKAVVLLGIVLGIDIAMVLAVFGLQAANYVFPVHALATYISTAGFLERVEAFVLGLWVAGVTVKIAIWFFCGAVVTAHTFGLKDYKPVVLPLGIIQGVWAITAFDNIRDLVEFFARAWITFSLSFEFVVPFTLLMVAVIRKKGGRRSAS